MLNSDDRGTRQLLSTVAAVVVVTLVGLAMNFGHRGALPLGVIEVGEMAPVKT